MVSQKTTPMLSQYLSIKEKYPDSILFYRMGDFYEMFFEDAVIASRLLEIALTSRNKNAQDPVPMCGFPFRAVEGYIAKLLDHGKKVTICEQVKDPAQAKGIVKREVVRVITPGMIVDDDLLDKKSNNYILSLSEDKKKIGLAFLDISTGDFKVTESDDFNSIFDECKRIAPSEIILCESFKNSFSFPYITEFFSKELITFLDKKQFSFNAAKNLLLSQFKTRSLKGFGLEDLKSGISAVGGLLHYVQETQLKKVEHLTKIETYYLSDYLFVDNFSCRNLELFSNIQTNSRHGSFLGVIDKTLTPIGGRLLKQWIRYPLVDADKIKTRLDATEEIKNNKNVRKILQGYLKSVFDLERLAAKISMNRANPRDLISLKISLKNFPLILSELQHFDSKLYHWDKDIKKLNNLADFIDKTILEDAPPVINEGGIIKTGYDKRLDELIKIGSTGRGWIAELEAKEKEKTGISSLKVKYNKVFGYFIEVSKANASLVPDNYIRKQTLVNAERYITDELKSFESKVLGAQEERVKLEYELFNFIRKVAAENNNLIFEAAKFIAQLDCLINFAEIAEHNNYTRPDINNSGEIFIKEARHPVVEKLLVKERYVPNTIKMDNSKNQVLIITGPNMAGKSTVLRQTALFVLMAQMGSFVPAEKASICLVDRIFTRVGALDNLSGGQSTFMVEMEETANIMNNVSPNSLVIMDEIGRGTSTFDGLSIAWAVAEYLHDFKNKGVKTLFATHYHELTNLAASKPRVKNFNIAVKEWKDNIIFLRKLVEGSTNKSYGIQVARLAGVPNMIIKRAKSILANIEKEQNKISGNICEESVKYSKLNEQKQLSLFEKNVEKNDFSNEYKNLVDKIINIEISSTTPIEALNYLNDLKKLVG